MSKNHYVSGDWNIHCDVCGKKIKASTSKKRWDGFIVCPEDFEIRHPQDFVRPKPEKISVDFVRKQPDVFKSELYIDGTDSVWDGSILDGVEIN